MSKIPNMMIKNAKRRSKTGMVTEQKRSFYCNRFRILATFQVAITRFLDSIMKTLKHFFQKFKFNAMKD